MNKSAHSINGTESGYFRDIELMKNIENKIERAVERKQDLEKAQEKKFSLKRELERLKHEEINELKDRQHKQQSLIKL